MSNISRKFSIRKQNLKYGWDVCNSIYFLYTPMLDKTMKLPIYHRDYVKFVPFCLMLKVFGEFVSFVYVRMDTIFVD